MDNPSNSLFQFVALRAAEPLSPATSRTQFIHDDCFFMSHTEANDSWHSHHLPSNQLHLRNGLLTLDLFSKTSISPIGRAVFQAVFTQKSTTPLRRDTASATSIKSQVIGRIETQLINGLRYTADDQERTTPIIKTISLTQGLSATHAMLLNSAAQAPTYTKGNTLHILPSTLADLPLPMNQLFTQFDQLLTAWLTKLSASPPTPFDTDTALKKLSTICKLQPRGFVSTVFDANGGYTEDYFWSKRIAFDCLYGLYLLGKRERVNLEPVMRALTLLHVLEAFAINQLFLDWIAQRAVPSADEKLFQMFAAAFPSLNLWEPARGESTNDLSTAGLPIINSLDSIRTLLGAEPMIHPIFARLSNSFQPFNALSPIGLGDLKVVKQRFLGYKIGEIAHIETVLAGETKTRIHRALDKVENTFNISTSTESENTKDAQSTTRFELKNEVESTLKTDIGVNVNSNFSYKGNPYVEASLGAGFNFASSKNTSEKAAQSFVNEVVNKAIARIQTRSAEQRSQTRIAEVEETNTHTFENKAPAENISGIYRWIDKVYEAQVHNYGRRLMFEFVLPEPANFFVESKLYAHAAELEIPKYPSDASGSATTEESTLPLGIKQAADIDESKYQELSRQFDLSAYPYPAARVENLAIRNINGELVFNKNTNYDDSRAGLTESFTGSVEGLLSGYLFDEFHISGSANFPDRDQTNDAWENTLDISINGVKVFHRKDETFAGWVAVEQIDLNHRSPNRNVDVPEMVYYQLPPNMSLNSQVRIDVFTRTCQKHALSFAVSVRRSDATYQTWQRAVFDEISRRVGQSSSSANSQDKQSRLMAYNKAIDELKATTVNEIIQGRSSAWNQAVIQRELKRQCITMIAKEFDTEEIDDVLRKDIGVGKSERDVYFDVFHLREATLDTKGKVVTEAQVWFEDTEDKPQREFSAINIDEANRRALYVQFLEQAFEWHNLSYLFYPYFWAAMPRWIQLMTREDLADPQFTEFLQAGSVRVLLAVKPGYESAVLHFLATREPWSGGPAPVIGDPLFIPLYEEVHRQQDDVANSTPTGAPWIFTLPTSLIYLESDKYKLRDEYKPEKPPQTPS